MRRRVDPYHCSDAPSRVLPQRPNELRTTVALCFQCGATKLGALVPCWQCGAGPTGNQQLDLLFSDHALSRETLEGFGAVVRKIAERTDDANERFWTFIQYVSTHHPELLNVELKPEMAARATALLAGLTAEPVVVERKPPRERPAPARAGRFFVLFVLLTVGLVALALHQFFG